eukprot:CAMPEP_0113497116 /NCGR_PEP_ID=MMETSP0014_2-20120614/30469_1 /TAXON_ID=2857 /ORGANISM="Nitzschia sp." /LENGTH=748 /DNA_ID=CAMNT_0000391055 /DNA_START=66 /DNA_END=2312 /DNA_ORIENTATION=- /assembly_acc=CAM_ASM_000159
MAASRRYSIVWILLAAAAAAVVVSVSSSGSGGLGTNGGVRIVEAFQQQQPQPQLQPQQRRQNQQTHGLETASLLSRRPSLLLVGSSSSPSRWSSLTSLSSASGEEDPSSPRSRTTNNADPNPNPPAFDSVTKESEKALRNEIATRNSIVDNEGQYTIRDGEGFSATAATTAVEETSSVATAVESSSSSSSSSTQPAAAESEQQVVDEFEKSFEKIIRQRPYPLFLLEKGIEIVEDTVEGIAAKFDNTVPADDLSIRGLPPSQQQRERLVVLGTGWGAAAFVKDIDTSRYDVTVISPRNYFLFTPMLAGASVGTVDYRSITQPIREINRKASYYEGTATDIDPVEKRISCESVVCDGNSCDIEEFSIDYDRLVVTIGAQTNTFGIPGVREHCNFLKEVEDARRIRTAIVNCFERANLPGLSDEQRIKDLTFAIIGAGPTGIEFSAELRDFIEQDGPKYYPNLLKFVRIKVIEASSTVLAPFDKSLQEEAISRMKRQVAINDPAILNLLPERFQLVELLLDSSVKEVTENTIMLNDGSDIDYGLAVWAAGNGPLPLTLQIVEELGEAQSSEQSVARGRIVTDAWMRSKGSEGSILAFGDCSCTTKGPDGPLPATGQVAAQQGEFLAKMMNQKYDLSPGYSATGQELPPTRSPEHEATVSEQIATLSTKTDEYAKPFQFLNLGILAYTGGGSALAQVGTGPKGAPIKGTGKVGNALWKSVYVSKQVSWRNRFMVINDWVRRSIFGRDITRV